MADAIVSIVVGRITDLLIEEPQLLHQVRDDTQQVVTELTRMKTFLKDADSRIDEDRVRILLQEVRELAYDAEHDVEMFLVETSSNERKRRKQENKYRLKINDMQRKVSVICERFRDYNIRSMVESPESSNSTNGTMGKLKRFHSFTTVEPEIFVGFQGDVDRLVGHLVDGTHDSYPLISICGMGGVGKTTIAQKIYNHSTIKKYFAGLAWVSISQKWQTKQVLQRILICLIHERKDEILKMDDDSLLENLKEIQQRKKCLIVLDDIWSTDAWDSIKKAFTAGKSISKLMLTSRKVNVAKYVNPKGLIHRPESLSPEQSWELLRLKALTKRGEYLDVARDFIRMEALGREMVRNCAGLPLAIVILGGILVTKPSLMEWEKVYIDCLQSLEKGKGLGENQQEQLFSILAQSYNDLPPQLKPCFLYLAKFKEDEWIDVENLYQLWIAEGMVLSSDKRDGETMMQVAESYMGELVHRSMVQVRFDNLEFKSCSLHDLLRDLSLFKAKQEDFFVATDLQEEKEFHLPMFAYTRQLVVNCNYRVGSKKAIFHIFKKSNHQHYRSMLLTNVFVSYSLPLGSHFAKFGLLRVLALENVELDQQTVSGNHFGARIETVIGNLIYLRYLRARNTNLMILPWIQKLVLLQTLKLDGFSITPSPPESTITLGKLAYLRHLYLPDTSYPMSVINAKLRINGLSKLETLENFDTRLCEVKDLPTLIGLQRLTLKVQDYYDNVEELMKYLATLALSSTSGLRYLALNLKIFDEGLLNNPNVIRQLFWNDKINLRELFIRGTLPELDELFEQHQRPNSSHVDASMNFVCITRLKLWSSCLEKDPMPVLEKIPTLIDLELYFAYKGNEMICASGGFPKLTRLKLEFLTSLKYWRVEEGSMPILSELTIATCNALEELPEGLIFLSALRKLLLWRMSSELCDRVRYVNDEQGADFYKIAHVPDLIIKNRH